MKVFKWLWSICIGMLPVLAYATAMSYIAVRSDWTDALAFPVYGAPIWCWELLRIVSYCAVIYVLARLIHKGSRGVDFVLVVVRFAGHLIAAALFFCAKRPDWACGALGVVALYTVAVAIVFFRKDKTCGVAFGGIALWDGYLTAVCAGVALLSA